MVAFNRIQAQLVKVDAVFATLGITDVKSLARILKHDEQIVTCLKGVYGGSPALLCATDRRLVLIRSKKQSTQINDLSYDSIVATAKNEKSWHSFITISTKDSVYSFKSARRRQAQEVYNFIIRHIAQLKTLASQSVPNYEIPKKFAHYTQAKSMRDLGDLAIVSMIH